MKTLKELIKTTLVECEALDNLSEKDHLNFYVDSTYTEEEVPELWKGIANELADKIMNVDFNKYDSLSAHPFIKAMI